MAAAVVLAVGDQGLMRFVPPSLAPAAFAVLMSGVMSCLVTCIATAKAIGLGPGFVTAWMAAWSLAWPVAAATLLLVGPQVRRLVGRITRGA